MYSVSVENTVARQPFTYNQTDGDGRERVHGICIGFLHYFAVSLCATESLYHGHAVRKYREMCIRDSYYSAVLTLFGQGWDQHRFRFTASGELQPDWNQECASSH